MARQRAQQVDSATGSKARHLLLPLLLRVRLLLLLLVLLLQLLPEAHQQAAQHRWEQVMRQVARQVLLPLPALDVWGTKLLLLVPPLARLVAACWAWTGGARGPWRACWAAPRPW